MKDSALLILDLLRFVFNNMHLFVVLAMPLSTMKFIETKKGIVHLIRLIPHAEMVWDKPVRYWSNVLSVAQE